MPRTITAEREAEPICGSCGLPISSGEVGVRRSGWFTSHSEHRCRELLKMKITAERAANQELETAYQKVVDEKYLEICAHQETQAKLAAEQARLDWIFLNGRGFSAMPVWGGPGRSYREVIDKEIAEGCPK